VLKFKCKTRVPKG